MKTDQATGDTHLKHLIKILTASKPLLSAYGSEALLATWEQLYIAVYQPNFNIGIIGASGRGKSTVINQLLEADVVPAGIFPGTALLTRIGYAETGGLTCVQIADLRDQMDASADSWEKIMETAENTGELIDVNLKIPHPWLKQFNCELLDTPGYGDHAMQVISVLPVCDTLVITISATMALGQTEIDFIEQSVLPLNIPHIAILVTRLDQLPPKDREAFVRYFLKTLENLQWDIRVFLMDVDGSLTSDAFADISGINVFRQTLKSWMTSDTHARLRFENLRTQVQLLLTHLIGELEIRRQDAEAAGQRKQKEVEGVMKEIAQLRLSWEELRLEMERRRITCEKLLNNILNPGRKDTLEQANLAVSRTNLPKEFAEKELPLILERQIRQIIKTAEAAIQQQIVTDGLWLKEKVAAAFLREIAVNRPDSVANTPELILNLNTRKYEDLQRSRQLSRICTGLATIGVYLLAGPMGIVVSIGGGFISDAVITGKIVRQRELLAKTIQDQVYKIFDDAIHTGATLISTCYTEAIQSTAEQEKAWMDIQDTYLSRQQTGHTDNIAKLETDLQQATQLLTSLLKQESLKS